MIEDVEPWIIEIDGPPMAYFDIPLDYTVAADGNLQMNDSLVRSPLTQRIEFYTFRIERDVPDTIEATINDLVDDVKRALRKTGDGGILWWRLRPEFKRDNGHSVGRVRLGTSPSLPKEFWAKLGKRFGSRNEAGVSP
jgi:hypothetical protein